MFRSQIQRKARMPVQEAYCGFLVHLGRFASSTQKSYARALERFFASTPEYISQISIEHIERYILTLQKTLKSSSCNTALAAIKSFYSWLEITHNIENIARKVKKLKALPPHQRVLSQEEYKRLIEVIEGDIKAVVSILCNTGMRISEFLSLKPENISGDFLSVFSTKTNKIRSIPLNRTAKEVLSNPTFFNILKSITRFHINYLFIKAAKAANIPKFSPHSCRHYFCTTLIKNGVPRSTVAKLMGDTVQTIDTVYCHLTNDDLIGSTDCLTL